MNDWLENLKKSKKLVVVEGNKDRNALNSFGIYNVITIKKPLFEVVENIASIADECILLLDLDKEGRKLYSYLKRNLERMGVKIDSKYREFLFRNTKLTNIEGLKKYCL